MSDTNKDNQKSIYDLKLHESATLNLGKLENGFGLDLDYKIHVLRVPGGWIYSGINEQHTPVFVPEPTKTKE